MIIGLDYQYSGILKTDFFLKNLKINLEN
jgi:hypothetical protein